MRKLAGVLGIPISEASTSDNKKKLFSTAVGAASSPENHVAALKTTKNAELIEQKEQEKRANNIIIHGISEVNRLRDWSIFMGIRDREMSGDQW